MGFMYCDVGQWQHVANSEPLDAICADATNSPRSARVPRMDAALTSQECELFADLLHATDPRYVSLSARIYYSIASLANTTGRAGPCLSHCRYCTGRMTEPKDRRRDEKDGV